MGKVWNEYYGATLPLKLAKTIQEATPALGAFGVGLLSGILTFFLCLVFCTFCLFLHEGAVLFIFAIATVVFSAFALTKERAIWRFPLGWCGLWALFWGYILGLYCYGTYGYFALVYANSRTYHNVDPAQRAGAVGDAGRMIFAAEAHVDAGRSVGYAAADGSIYCAAPILGIGPPLRVEFWAVGKDCCSFSGAFHCGAVDDPDARGGAVLFKAPTSGPLGLLFGSDFASLDRYDMARKKAQASLGAFAGSTSSKDAVLVRWMSVRNLALLSRHYAEQAWVFIAVSTFVYSLLSAPIAWAASRLAVAVVPATPRWW